MLRGTLYFHGVYERTAEISFIYSFVCLLASALQQILQQFLNMPCIQTAAHYLLFHAHVLTIFHSLALQTNNFQTSSSKKLNISLKKTTRCFWWPVYEKNVKMYSMLPQFGGKTKSLALIAQPQYRNIVHLSVPSVYPLSRPVPDSNSKRKEHGNNDQNRCGLNPE